MANVVLFHSVYGRRPAVEAAADLMRSAGHTVLAPDLYEGEVADNLEVARGIRERIGIPTLLERAYAAVGDPKPGTVYAGFSMGAAVAEACVRKDPAAGGLILLHAVGDAEDNPQPTCRAQAHVADGDPFATPEETAEWARAYGERAEVFTYPGGGHLYTDDGLPDYDHGSAELTWQRVLEFLRE
jgi:dienelactone hydrolase